MTINANESKTSNMHTKDFCVYAYLNMCSALCVFRMCTHARTHSTLAHIYIQLYIPVQTLPPYTHTRLHTFMSKHKPFLFVTSCLSSAAMARRGTTILPAPDLRSSRASDQPIIS